MWRPREIVPPYKEIHRMFQAGQDELAWSLVDVKWTLPVGWDKRAGNARDGGVGAYIFLVCGAAIAGLD